MYNLRNTVVVGFLTALTIIGGVVQSVPVTSSRAIEDDVIFWHHLPGDMEGSPISLNCSDNCLSNYVKTAPTVLVTHGFRSDGHHSFVWKNIRDGFSTLGDPVNMILIDWDKLSSSLDYGGAVKSLEPVGEYSASLLNFLVDQGLATLNDTYFIGHSLGAHMVNYISRHLTGGKLKSAFGLDPAWPLFDRRNDSERMDPEDAEFVSVIHTSTVYQGFKDPTGHADFYPNNGKSQPGCDDNIVGACSHEMCHVFFEESVFSADAFQACKCSSWEEYDEGSCVCEESVVMGWNTPRTARGVFYLRTNPEPPYGT